MMKNISELTIGKCPDPSSPAGSQRASGPVIHAHQDRGDALWEWCIRTTKSLQRHLSHFRFSAAACSYHVPRHATATFLIAAETALRSRKALHCWPQDRAREFGLHDIDLRDNAQHRARYRCHFTLGHQVQCIDPCWSWGCLGNGACASRKCNSYTTSCVLETLSAASRFHSAAFL